MIKTINLNGHTSVSIDAAHVHIRNDGENNVCVAVNPNPVYGQDGVLTIPPGQAGSLYNCSGTVYVNGNGAITLVTSNYVTSPFKCAPASSASSGGGTSGGGSEVTTEPILKAGSFAYYLQDKHVTGNIGGVNINTMRWLFYVPQDLSAYKGWTMPESWRENELDHSAMVVNTQGTIYGGGTQHIDDSRGSLQMSPDEENGAGFFTPRASLADYLVPYDSNFPFPPVQLVHVAPHGVYFWAYITTRWADSESYNRGVMPAILLTADVPLPLIPPDGVPI